MKFEDLFKVAEEKYQCSYNKEYKTIKIKFDYFTILIEETEKRELHVKMQRGSSGFEGFYSIKIMCEMFKNDKRKIVDFIIFRSLEHYYTQKCKSLL